MDTKLKIVKDERRSEVYKIVLSAFYDGIKTKDFKFAWRINGGKWHYDTKGSDLYIALLKKGKYTIEAFSYKNALFCDLSQVKKVVDVGNPSVKINIPMDKNVFQVSCIRIPFSIESGGIFSPSECMWRVNKGRWHKASNNYIEFTAKKDGYYNFEVKPIVADENIIVLGNESLMKEVKIKIVIDYKKVILEVIKRLKSSNIDERERGKAQILKIGKKAIPYLEKEYKNAETDDYRYLLN